MATILVTGHRNPDLDSVGSAIAYAELLDRTDDENDYRPARLGEVNAQTAWALERAGAEAPELLRHVKLRVRDVMVPCEVTAGAEDPVRGAGLAMAEHGLDVVPVLDGDGVIAGVLSERALARRYMRESRDASDFSGRAVSLEAVREILDGEILVTGDGDVSGRLWVLAMEAEAVSGIVDAGDIAVVGDLPASQLAAIELGVDLLVLSNGTRPPEAVVEAARAARVNLMVSPLDSYVSARMIQLAVPVGRIMDAEPLTVEPDDVLEDVTPEILDVDYRTAVVVDGRRRPVGLVGRSALVGPAPRKVMLVDHAEESQSAPGIEQAEIVEILDHHNILDRDAHARAGDVRPGRLDRDARRRALRRRRHRALARGRHDAAGRRALGHGRAHVADGHGPRPARRRDAGRADRRGTRGLRAGDVRGVLGRLGPLRRGDRARDAKTYELERERTALVGQVEVVGEELLRARTSCARRSRQPARRAGTRSRR